jgi:hypothetical protein
MDTMVTLKKKLSTYVTEKGQLRNVNDELLFEVLTAWESWTGTAVEFYRGIGFSQKQMAGIVGKAKKLKREGHFGSGDFRELKIEGMQEVEIAARRVVPGELIELDRGQGVLIRFPRVEQLIEFLKKAS